MFFVLKISARHTEIEKPEASEASLILSVKINLRHFFPVPVI